MLVSKLFMGGRAPSISGTKHNAQKGSEFPSNLATPTTNDCNGLHPSDCENAVQTGCQAVFELATEDERLLRFAMLASLIVVITGASAYKPRAGVFQYIHLLLRLVILI
jgi:hypothetical protein